MLAVRVLLHFWQHRLQRQFHIPDQPQLQRAAIAQCFGAQVDLRDIAVLRIKLAIREIGAQHQQGVTAHHGLVTRCKTDQPGHADVIRVVVFDMFLAAQCVHDRGVQALGQGQDFRVGTGAACAAEQGDFFAVIEK